jgi:Putative phage tail protein
MATLILSAVGSAVGGPIGGAIGSILGQAIDQRIFAPKARHGPRLGDLSVQTSSYGTAIPRIFGTMRVAGTVIWATDLAEHRGASGGGKGRPKTIDYSYSASFAVALSARPILGVGRIWADGKLLRGAAGDFKSATGFRLYPGDEDQPVDPLIAAAEGLGAAPAFRGLAYALFEDFQLEDYGNRIPSLSFEVAADPGAVAIGAIAAALGGGAVTAGATPALAGYAASGDSIRSAIEALADVVPLSLADDGETLRLAAAGDGATALDPADEHGRRELTRRGAGSVRDEVSLTYYEIERDYQAGLQRAIRGDGAAAGIADRRALPAALGADAAKALAGFRLAAAWAARATAKVSLSWRGCAVRPGDRVTLAGDAGRWKVERFTLGPMIVDLELVRMARDSLPDPAAASPGLPVGQIDLPHGPTLLHLLDLPLGDGLGNKPLLFVAAAGSGEGWRRAILSASYDGGGSWQGAGATAAPAAIGTVPDALPAAGSALFDTISTLEVELANAAMWLEGRSDDALAGGANLALVGSELIQFGAAEPLGANRFRLSRLLRGRRGTEWAAASHAEDERFVLLAAESLVVLEAPVGSVGGEASLLATGIGDLPDAASAAIPIEGAALQPPSPVHLRAEETGGDLLIRWVRRSRQGWTWPSGSDTPLGEERELYRLEIAGDGFTRTVTPGEPHYLYTAAQRAEDGAATPLQISVVQIGTFAPSRPAHLTSS